MKLRLQTSIAVLLVGLILATVAAMGLSSYYYSLDSADKLRTRILEDTSRDIYEEIGRLVQSARNQTAYDRDQIQNGAVRAGDFTRLTQYWMRVLETHRELAFLAATLENGDRLRIGRSADGDIYIQEWRFDAATKQVKLRVFEPRDYPDGKPLFAPAGKHYDIQSHPWFRAARRAGPGQQVWTESYSLLDEHGYPGIPGTACVTPVYGKDGKRIALLTAGIDVLSLCEYLRKLQVGQHGFAFVAEFEENRPTAVIVAHHPVDSVWRKITAGADVGNRELVPTAEIEDLRVRAFMAQLPAAIDRGPAAGFKPVEFTVDGTHFAGGYQYLVGSDTPDWIICTVMPEQEIMANVWRNNLWMAGIGLATMLGAALAGMYVARQIARPLEKLMDETRVIGQYDLGARPAVPSRVTEVSHLAIALEEMKTSLRSFQKYVPVDLVRTLMATKQEAALGGTARTLTIFFSDIVGFTEIAEGLDPSVLVEHLREYFGAMSAEIVTTGGTVDKYIGDAVMAFWGAPHPNPQHALAACTAALHCQATLRQLRPQWQEAGRPLFKAKIGLHTGEVVVGNIGSEARLNYTVIGDAVNLASRLENLNRHYGTEIIISERTFVAAKAGIVVRLLDWVSVKGRTAVVPIYELLGLPGATEPRDIDIAHRYAAALVEYRRQAWEHAIELFDDVLRLRPEDGPSQQMAARCRRYQVNPPGETWDGVYRHADK